MNSFIYLSLILIDIKLLVECDDDVYRWDADIYPNLTSPQSAKFCTGSIRNPPSSICDPDVILTKEEALTLDQLIDEERNETKCICDYCPPHKRGLIMKIALIKFVKVMANVSLDRSVELFAERTRRKWRFGEECSNDVLIFFAAMDDRIYISLGSRAKRVLSDDDIQTILKDTRIHFTSGYYQQGLESIIASFQDLSEEYNPKQTKKLSIGSVILIVLISTVAVILLLFAIFWFLVKRNSKPKKSSFEFIGSWGRSKGSNTQTKSRIAPIYTPVKTSDTKVIDDKTLPI